MPNPKTKRASKEQLSTILGPHTPPTGKSRSQEIIESILDGIRELATDEALDDQYILAAFVDWMRQEWCGDGRVLGRPDIEAYRWTLHRAARLRQLTLEGSALDVLRAAVTS